MVKQPDTLKTKSRAPTIDQINADRITQLANRYWAPNAKNKEQYDPKIIEDIYYKEILGSKFSLRRIMMLELSQFLENYLWPNFKTGSSSHAHIMSIVVILNEKFRERVPAWEPFKKNPEHFPGFFNQLLEVCLLEGPKRVLLEQTALIVLLNHFFNSMEVELIREQVKKLVSLSMWISLHEARREHEFKLIPKWKKFWKILQKRESQEQAQKAEFERKFLHKLILGFIETLDQIPDEGVVSVEYLHYCERFLELMIDLEALLPTRRFFNTVLDDTHLVTRCSLSSLTKRPEGNLFVQMYNEEEEMYLFSSACRRVFEEKFGCSRSSNRLN